jgi:hypothetical protein
MYYCGGGFGAGDAEYPGDKQKQCVSAMAVYKNPYLVQGELSISGQVSSAQSWLFTLKTSE